MGREELRDKRERTQPNGQRLGVNTVYSCSTPNLSNFTPPFIERKKKKSQRYTPRLVFFRSFHPAAQFVL
jgi:hypothetical protein